MFHLTNRIRTNAELSSFIQNMLHLTDRKTSKPYPHVSVVYANNEEEAAAYWKIIYIRVMNMRLLS